MTAAFTHSRDSGPPPQARPQYLIAGLRVAADDPALQTCLASVYRDRGEADRPRCLCTQAGAEMYISRIAGVFHLKRMPGHGADHAGSCQSYEPPANLSGLGQVLGAAIQEDPLEGTTSLRLGFSLARVSRRQPAPSEASIDDSASTSGARLSLRGLLHYLWEEAGFNRWSPAMHGKRSWPVLRRYLLAAVERKHCRGAPLIESLYIPEAWDEARREEIAARRRALFLNVASVRKGARKLMLLLGEVRLIEPARYGHRLVVKHAPDVEFGLDEALSKTLQRRFETELLTWDAQRAVRDRAGHLIVFGTFSVGPSGRPAMEELVLMSTSRNWIPIDDAFDAELIERLTAAGYRFNRCLRYNLPAARPLACAIVPDADPEPTALYVVRPGVGETYDRLLDEVTRASGMVSWIWRAGDGALPDLPRQAGRAPSPPRPVQARQPQTPDVGFDPFAASDRAGAA